MENIKIFRMTWKYSQKFEFGYFGIPKSDAFVQLEILSYSIPLTIFCQNLSLK